MLVIFVPRKESSFIQMYWKPSAILKIVNWRQDIGRYNECIYKKELMKNNRQFAAFKE